MKLSVLTVLAMAVALSSCATDPGWERVRPPSRMTYAANGCATYTIDDAAPLSQWKPVGDFWDQDTCQGTPFSREERKGRLRLSREEIRDKAKAGGEASIETVKCWDQKDYLTWTAPVSSSLVGHEWNAIPYTCVEKDDPRLAKSGAAKSPEVATTDWNPPLPKPNMGF